MAYLRLALHPGDDLAFRRIANVPPRGIGAVFMERLDAAARESGRPLLETLHEWADRGQLLGARYEEARRLSTLMRALAELREESVDVVAELAIERSGFRKYLETSEPEAAEDRLANVNEFVAGAHAFAVRAEEPTLPAFLAEVALLADVDRMAEDAERATLLTAHAAKGLEFRVVCVVGMEEGLFPHSSAMLEPAELEEERRLFYVALTRAREQVVLSAARHRYRYDLPGTSLPSRFLGEIPPELIEGGAPRPEAHRAVTPAPRALPRREAVPVEAGPSWVGRTLAHAQFGPGRVVEQEGKGSHAKLTVEFSGGVRRKILARYLEDQSDLM